VNTTAVLDLRAVGKRYRAYATPVDRFKHLLGLQHRATDHWALKDVSFALARGQCLGVVGDNGAGKSTLLKLLAGTLQPSHGQLTRVGRLTAILELGAGFHPEFTGRDNLVYAGSFIGISQTEMLQLASSIIGFAELQDAIDRPVKTYSSGMVVRLAFALVTAVPPDVLIIDEALAVGDQHFQKKCVQRIEEFRLAGCTVLFCSHSLYHVRQLCDIVLWLHQGQVHGYGATDAVLASYESHVRLQDTAAVVEKPQLPILNADRRASLLLAEVQDLRSPAANTNSQLPVLLGPDLTVNLQALSVDDEPPSFGVMLEQLHGVGVTSVAMHAEGVQPSRMADDTGQISWQTMLTFDQLPLHSGHYVLSFYLFDARGLVVLDEWKNHITFDWVSPSLTPGLVKLPHRWLAPVSTT